MRQMVEHYQSFQLQTSQVICRWMGAPECVVPDCALARRQISSYNGLVAMAARVPPPSNTHRDRPPRRPPPFIVASQQNLMYTHFDRSHKVSQGGLRSHTRAPRERDADSQAQGRVVFLGVLPLAGQCQARQDLPGRHPPVRPPPTTTDHHRPGPTGTDPHRPAPTGTDRGGESPPPLTTHLPRACCVAGHIGVTTSPQVRTRFSHASHAERVHTLSRTRIDTPHARVW